MKYLLSAILLQLPFGFLTDFMILGAQQGESITTELSIVLVLLLYSIILLVYTLKQILPQIQIQSGRRKRMQQKMKKED
jgi:hypothetical protein